MQELVGRLAALDPDAAEAVRVIAHFDSLVESRVGLEGLLRTAAFLAGCPAGLSDPARQATLRVLPDGRRADRPFASPACAYAIPGMPDAQVWLERAGPAHANDDIVGERLATAVREVIFRTWPQLPKPDPAALELLVDGRADVDDRRAVAGRMGLPTNTPLRVVVSLPGAGTPARRRTFCAQIGSLQVVIEPSSAGHYAGTSRAGIGIEVGIDALPESYDSARVALRLTAEDTPQDPGSRHARAADLGGLLVLAVGCDTPAATTEVELLERANSQHPWALATLDALGRAGSVRAAATDLRVHHSTLQDHIEVLSRALGYSLNSQTGRTRGQLALALRRLQRNRF